MQIGHQLLLRPVILQLIAGMTEHLKIGNIAASAFRNWYDVIDGQISRLEVMAASGAVPTLPSVQNRMVHPFPPVLLLPLCGFVRRVTCWEPKSWGRCLGSQFHRYVDSTAKTTGPVERKTTRLVCVEVGLDLDSFRQAATLAGQLVCLHSDRLGQRSYVVHFLQLLHAASSD